jgi:hypothetical protein
MMKNPHEIILSVADAALLRSLLGDRSGELLRHAYTCAPEHLPEDRAAIGSKVVYLEEPWHIRRSVTLCHPDDAGGRLDRPFTFRVIEVSRASEKEAA